MQLQWMTIAFDDLTSARLYDVLKLRQQVFIIEQNCLYPDLDDKDQLAMHLLGYVGDDLQAYQRCLPPGVSYAESSLGRIVVAAAARGHKLGGLLVQRGIEHNLQRWPGHDICISAQAHLQGFYATLGFSAEGEPYREDGIPHRKMRLRAPRQVRPPPAGK